MSLFILIAVVSFVRLFGQRIRCASVRHLEPKCFKDLGASTNDFTVYSSPREIEVVEEAAPQDLVQKDRGGSAENAFSSQ